ncbi:sigma-70 family RNA polymerase sigma factor [Kitasatospora sp. NPDC094016]|uniref:sigma-70 family RNA polymerase sigma factor n=1 Tax=Kitasatospora sp. NPDC094016 TaxID=3154986 RepID=UPI003317B068
MRAEAAVEDLVTRVGHGDESAFNLLHDAVSAALFLIVLRVVRDRAQTQEVVQEVLLEIWDKAHRFEPARGTAMAWIATVAHRRAVDRVRTARAAAERDLRARLLDHVPDFDDVSEQVEHRLRHEQIRDCLLALTDLQRQAVDMVYFQGLSCQEFTDRLNLPLGTAKSRVRDALLRLRTCMEDGT